MTVDRHSHFLNSSCNIGDPCQGPHCRGCFTLFKPLLVIVSKITVPRASSKSKQMHTIRALLNIEAAKLIYKIFLLPILEYGDVNLSAISKVNKDKVQVLPNKGPRLVPNGTRLSRTCRMLRCMSLETFMVVNQ